MIKKILAMAAAAAILSLCLYFSLSAYLRYRNDYVTVYVASHQLAQRNRITAQDLQEVKVPRQVISDDIYVNLADIEGKYVRLAFSIPKGSLIYKKALETDIKDLAHTLLLKGQVSYDLYTHETRMNTGSLQDSMYVDIYLTLDVDNRPLSDLLIKDCRIIGMYDSNGRQILAYDSDSRPYIVTIAIEQSEVNILNNALKLGEVSLIVNNNTYQTEVRSRLNEESKVLEYLG